MWSKMVKNDQNSDWFQHFWLFCHFQSVNQHFQSFNWHFQRSSQSFNRLFIEMFEINRKWSNRLKIDLFNRILTLSFNRNPIFVFRFKSDWNQRLYSDSFEFESLTIQFVGPNCLSIPSGMVLKYYYSLQHVHIPA